MAYPFRYFEVNKNQQIKQFLDVQLSRVFKILNMLLIEQNQMCFLLIWQPFSVQIEGKDQSGNLFVRMIPTQLQAQSFKLDFLPSNAGLL